MPRQKSAHIILVEKITDTINFLEARNLTLDTIYLNPVQVRALAKSPHFTRLSAAARKALVLSDTQPGVVIGHLWTADIREHPAVPDGHAAITVKGMTLRDLTREACFSLHLD